MLVLEVHTCHRSCDAQATVPFSVPTHSHWHPFHIALSQACMCWRKTRSPVQTPHPEPAALTTTLRGPGGVVSPCWVPPSRPPWPQGVPHRGALFIALCPTLRGHPLPQVLNHWLLIPEPKRDPSWRFS